MEEIFCSFVISVGLLLLLIPKKKQKGGNNMLNIYNNKLKPCGNKIMSSGSWDNKKMCSEKDGGVHQICIKKISKNTPKFSSTTGQSNWSDKRENDNHCVCLGAWSLYNKKKHKKNKKNILKCDAIPKISLSDDYISKFSEGWNKWNGLELENQIVDGVENMVKICSNTTKKNKKNLLKNYCNFSKNHKILNNTKFYKSNCKK